MHETPNPHGPTPGLTALRPWARRAGWLLPAVALLAVSACGEDETPAPGGSATTTSAGGGGSGGATATGVGGGSGGSTSTGGGGAAGGATQHQILLQTDWPVTGDTDEAVQGGAFGSVSISQGSNGDYWTVQPDGPGSRHRLEMRVPAAGGSWVYEHQDFANPAEIYVRFWFRLHSTAPNMMHPMVVGYSDSGTHMRPQTGEGIYLLSMYGVPSDPHWRVLPPDGGVSGYCCDGYTITAEDWYRIEYRIQGGGTAQGTIDMRVYDDGGTQVVDSADCQLEWGGGSSLADDAGGIDLTAAPMRYLALEIYDTTPTGPAFDIAGLMVTSGPDWIGDY